METNSKSNVAFLWDESFLWGLMAYKALKSNGLSFKLIRSKDIKNGQLKNYKMLFVPGGWASNKLKTLEGDCISKIKQFVSNGGNYLGFCGGAGLATLEGLGLLNIKRKPTKERVPSFSGRICLNINEHPIWKGLLTSSLVTHHLSLIFNAWWPSQFLIEDKSIKILATYGDALPDSFISDLNVGDVEANGGWSELEEIYQINLNSKRLLNEPAVVEGSVGKGRVILSLIHFDTPDDINGARVLRNLWGYLSMPGGRGSWVKSQDSKHGEQTAPHALPLASELISEIESAVTDLIILGMRNFLWFWRNSMLLQWRRGVRGLEYCTLYVMIKEIMETLKTQNTEIEIHDTEKSLRKIKGLLIPFVGKAKRLLILERFAIQSGHITYERCGDPEIQKIRTELFSSSKRHGGLFKKLIDEIDNLLYLLITREEGKGGRKIICYCS